MCDGGLVGQLRIEILLNGLMANMAGGEYHMLKVANLWSKTYNVSIVTPRNSEHSVKTLSPNADVLTYRSRLECDQLLNRSLRTALLSLARVFVCSLQRNTADVVLATSHYPHDVIPAIIHSLRNGGVPVVVYIHSIFIPHQQGLVNFILSLVNNYLGIFLSRLCASLIFVINEPTRSLLASMGYPPRQLITITNGVDLPTGGISFEKEYDGCYVGRFARPKGIYDLIEVWSKICDQRPFAKLLLIGSGEEINGMRQLLLSLGLSGNVILRDQLVSDQEKFECLMKSRVFISPSYNEGWGIAVAEAIACKVPAVVYALPTYGQIFGDFVGSSLFSVPIGDKNQLALGILRLLQNPIADQILSANSERLLEKYEWKGVAWHELKFIENTLSRKKADLGQRCDGVGLMKGAP